VQSAKVTAGKRIFVVPSNLATRGGAGVTRSPVCRGWTCTPRDMSAADVRAALRFEGRLHELAEVFKGFSALA